MKQENNFFSNLPKETHGYFTDFSKIFGDSYNPQNKKKKGLKFNRSPDKMMTSPLKSYGNSTQKSKDNRNKLYSSPSSNHNNFEKSPIQNFKSINIENYNNQYPKNLFESFSKELPVTKNFNDILSKTLDILIEIKNPNLEEEKNSFVNENNIEREVLKKEIVGNKIDSNELLFENSNQKIKKEKEKKSG